MATKIENSPTEINVIIIGETGCGKSTLINYLTNLFNNGSLTNLKVAIPTRFLESNMFSIMPEHHEEFLDDITRRKTSQCTKYQFKIEHVFFNFFDTPGINDTGGYLIDNENLDKIFRCMETFDELTALVFVLNGTQARLTINIKNVLERFHDRIPDIFQSNIIVILTNCSSHTVNFDSMNVLNYPPIFYMQNSAFSTDPRTWTDETRRILQRDWNISIKTMNEFIKTLVLLQPISTNILSNINHDRDSIRSILHETRLIIMELQHIEDELISLEQASKIYEKNMEKYLLDEDLHTKTINANEITVTSYHNTICIQCNIVCHERCTLSETNQIGERVFRRCKVMHNGQCSVCPNKCSSDMHYHDRRLIKSVSRPLKNAITSLSNKYTEAEKDKTECEIKHKTIKKTKRLIQQKLDEQFNKVENACERVQNQCQGFNVAEELITFINLLENDINSLRSSSVTNQVTIFIDKLKSLANNNSEISSKPSRAARAKRKKRNQPQITSIEDTNNQIDNSTPLIELDPTPTDISIFDNDLFKCIQNSQEQTSNISNTLNYAECTTEQLMNFTRQSIEKQILIANELNRRCQEASIGYLSATQLLKLCEYYTTVNLLERDELHRLHTELQSEIKQLTDSNPFDVLSISTEKLLHLTAVKLCLESVNKPQ